MVKFDEYHVLPVLGALSAADLQYARDLAPVFTSDNRWTVASLASLITPSTAQLPLISSRTGESTSVTFTQASSLYFSSNLTAVGPAASLWKAFQNQAGYGLNPEFSSQDANLGDLAQNSDLLMAARPVMVEFPLWGSRVACTTMRQGPEASTIRPLPSSVNSTRGVPDFFMAVTNETVRNLLARVDGDQDLASNPVLYNTTIDPNLLPTGQVISGTTLSISFFFFFQGFTFLHSMTKPISFWLTSAMWRWCFATFLQMLVVRFDSSWARMAGLWCIRTMDRVSEMMIYPSRSSSLWNPRFSKKMTRELFTVLSEWL